MRYTLAKGLLTGTVKWCAGWADLLLEWSAEHRKSYAWVHSGFSPGNCSSSKCIWQGQWGRWRWHCQELSHWQRQSGRHKPENNEYVLTEGHYMYYLRNKAIKLAQAAWVRHTRWRLQCVAGHCYYQLSVSPLSSFFYVFFFWPTSRKLPRLKICFPQYFGKTRRYMLKKIVGNFNFFTNKKMIF